MYASYNFAENQLVLPAHNPEFAMAFFRTLQPENLSSVAIEYSREYLKVTYYNEAGYGYQLTISMGDLSGEYLTTVLVDSGRFATRRASLCDKDYMRSRAEYFALQALVAHLGAHYVA